MHAPEHVRLVKSEPCSRGSCFKTSKHSTARLNFPCALRTNTEKSEADDETRRAWASTGAKSNSHAHLGPGTMEIIPEIARNAGSSRVPDDRKPGRERVVTPIPANPFSDSLDVYAGTAARLFVFAVLDFARESGLSEKWRKEFIGWD